MLNTLVAQLQATYYISPSGNDNYKGTIDSPFVSLEKARNVVRTINTNMTGDILVYLRAGTYSLSSTFVLDAKDKATNGYKIIYQSYLCETPVISGGVTIQNWQIHDSQKNIYKSVVTFDYDTRQLYVNGVRATRARSIDAAGWTETADGYTCSSSLNPATWGNLTSVEVVARTEWRCSRGPISAVSGTNVTMSPDYWTKVKSSPSTWTRFATPAWIENAYELIDQPGEWYFNKATKTIYYKPRTGENMSTATVMFPFLVALIKGTDLTNVQFKGITFSYGTWARPNYSNGFACHQGDVALNDVQLASNLNFTSCSNLLFDGNTFEHLGATALHLNTGCKNNNIVNNTFTDISGSGITLGNTGLKNAVDSQLVKNNLINDNLIDKVAVEYEGSLGIFAVYTENTTIKHNEIRNIPYSGISVGWGWSNTTTAGRNNEIAYNRIDSCMISLKDGGGIYTISNQPGTKIHHNYITNQFNDFASLYPDEGSSDMHWHHNVTRNNRKWLHIWTSSIQNNTIDSNYYEYDAMLNNGTNNTITNNFLVNADQWNTEALNIIKNAGKTNRTNIAATTMPINIALNKTATSSANYNSSFPASAAVDGKTSSNWASLTGNAALNCWWQVDLGQAYTIKQIEVEARKDIEQVTARKNFEIRLSNNVDFSSYVVGATLNDAPFPAYGSYVSNISTTTQYRYVRIQRINSATHINFSEVRIYETAIDHSSPVFPRKVCAAPKSKNVNLNATYKLSTTVLPANATDKRVKFASGNTTIATVSSNGTITGKKAGKTKILVSMYGGTTYVDTCSVKVVEPTTTARATVDVNYISNANASDASVIDYEVLEPQYIDIALYDAMGRRLQTLLHQKQETGKYVFNTKNNITKNGVYFIVIQSKEIHKTQKLIITNR
jgi:hypothetical protein